MDGLPQNQYPPQPSVLITKSFLQSTQGKLVLAGAIILLLLLGLTILNYFTATISFLPHRILSQKAPPLLPKNNIQTVESPVGKTVLAFLSTILNSSFAPSRINIISKDSGAYAASWQAKEGTASATIATKNEGKTITSINLFIPVRIASVSTELAPTLISPFFSVQPKGTWACTTLYKDTTYCENFWQDVDDTKKGVGIIGPPYAAFFCQQSKDSLIYNWKSCTIEFATTGVK